MDIYILRDGKEIGPFNEETTHTLLKQGAIVINDLAWQPGMAQWTPLHSVLYPAPAPTCHDAKPPAPAESPAATSLEPATGKQKAFLSYMGVAFPTDLTKEQAALLVNDTMENPTDPGRLVRWAEERLRLDPELFHAEIQAKKENRANHFYAITQSEGAHVVNNVTKAHCQVLVGFLDVRFPNWDANERQAIWDYFFPAIAEKFPHLLKKEWKRKLKYPEGPKVAPELAQHAGMVKKRRTGFPTAIIMRATGTGLAILIILFAGYNLATRKPWRKSPKVSHNLAASESAGAPDVADTGKPGTAGVDLEKLFAENPPATPSTQDTSTASSTSGTSPSTTPMEAGRVAESPPASSPTAAPLFDATAPATGLAPPSDAVVSQPRTTLVITKAIDVPLRFGHAKLPPGTVVKFVGQDGALLRVRYGGEIVVVPAASTDFLNAPPVSLSPLNAPNSAPATNPAAPIGPPPSTVPSAPTSLF